MSSPARCDCCDLPVESCGRATEQRQQAEAAAERRALLNRPGWFAAHWPGRCAFCNEWFPSGVPITAEGDGYRAGCCA